MSPQDVESDAAVPKCGDVVTGEAERFLDRAGWLRQSVQGDQQADALLERGRQLRFIGLARSVGYELHECRALIALTGLAGDDGPRHAHDVLRQVEAVEQKIVALMKLRQILLELLAEAPKAPVTRVSSGESPQASLLRLFDRSGEGLG